MQGHFRDVIARLEAGRDRNGPVNGRVNGCHRIRVSMTASGSQCASLDGGMLWVIPNRVVEKDWIQKPSCRRMGERRLTASESFRRKVVKKLWSCQAVGELRFE